MRIRYYLIVSCFVSFFLSPIGHVSATLFENMLQNDETKPPLLTAIQNGSPLDVIKKIVNDGANIYFVDDLGQGYLHNAMWNSYSADHIEYLLSLGLDPNLTDHSIETPIFRWNSRGSIETLKALVKGGANLEHKNIYNQTALHSVLRDRVTEEALRNFLKFPININAIDSDGQNPLMVLLEQSRDTKLFDLLMEAGVNVNHLDNEKRSAWYYLFSSNTKTTSVQFADYLAKKLKSTIDHKDNKGQFPLYYASAFNQSNVVKVLLANGADVHAATNFKAQGVHIAAQFIKSLEIIKLLIEAGADVNAKTKNGNTPLHYAVSYLPVKIDLVKYLVEQGADINVKTVFGKTPLMIASRHEQNKEATEYLISLGAK